jgi:hypothetical protein
LVLKLLNETDSGTKTIRALNEMRWLISLSVRVILSVSVILLWWNVALYCVLVTILRLSNQRLWDGRGM